MIEEWFSNNPNLPTFAGPTSLFRFPYGNPEGADVVAWGVPLDLTTTGRSGARLGPRAIRAASTMISWGKSFPAGIDFKSALKAVDAGDCIFDHGIAQDFVERIYEFADRIVSANAIPLTMGGDHFISYPVIKALAKKHGPLALVHFDAHPDTWPDDEKRTDHGTMFYHAVKEGLIDPKKSVQIGLRTYVEDHLGILCLDAPWVHENGAKKTYQAIKDRVGKQAAYLTFDIDCLDPAFAPGTGTPVPGGLSSATALEIVRNLNQIDFKGYDVVEVSPPFDHADMTALAGAQLLLEMYLLAIQNHLPAKSGKKTKGKNKKNINS